MDKFKYFNHSAEECDAVEEYLQLMEEKGWKLHDISGAIFHFKPSESKRVKYSIDHFYEKDLNKSKEYIEYCNTVGWEFVCTTRKMQIFRNEDPEGAINIHTDEEEKFNLICQIGKGEMLSKIILVLIFIYNIYLNISSSSFFVFTSNMGLISLGLMIAVTVVNLVDIASFFKWRIKAKLNIKNGKPIEYSSYKGVQIKTFIMKVILIGAALALVYEESYIFIGIIIIFIGITILDKVLERRRCNGIIRLVANIIIIVIVMVGAVNLMGDSENSNYNIDISATEALQQIGYSDDSSVIEWIVDNESIIGSNKIYSITTKNEENIYIDIFYCKIPSIVDFCENKLFKKYKEYNADIIEVKLEKYDDIKLYKNSQVEELIFISDDKIVKVSSEIKELKEEVLIENVCKNIM